MNVQLNTSVICEETTSGYRHVYVGFSGPTQVLKPADVQLRIEFSLEDLITHRDAVDRAITFLREHEAAT